MIYLFLFISLFLISHSGYSQANITSAEYFIDTDPGPGNGVAITAFSPGTTINVSTFNISTTSLAIGRHLLCVRTKNANNVWGYYECRVFYISGPNTPLTPDPPTANITSVEYFIDTDPGMGNGTAVTGFSAGTTIDIATFNVSSTSLAIGRHLLCVRAKNANNVWGYYDCRAFYINSPNTPITPDPPPANITALEYFFDTAPAPGSGVSIPMTPGTDVTLGTFNIPTTSLATGWHILGIRGRNANGTWGYYDVRRIYIQQVVTAPPVTTPSPIVAFEYSIDTDPGTGNGTYTIPVSPASHSVDLANQNLNVGSLSLGTHKVVIRGKNQNNQWGFYEVRNFSVCNQVPTVMSEPTSLTTISFTANWGAATGATSYQLDVSKDNFVTFVTGYNNKTIVALSETISGLTTATNYQYRVRAVSTCASDYVTTTVTTLLTLPTAQPSNLNFASTSNSLALTFSAASGSPTGYLVIRKAGSSPVFVPENNTIYSVGDDAADSKVAYVGAAPAFLDAGLVPDTDYYYKIYSYNQSGALYSYLTSITPLQGNRKTLAMEPAAQATSMQFDALQFNSFNVSFNAASGSPAGYLVLRKAGSTPTAIPVDGTTYTTTVGTDAVVHNGATPTFSQTGLTQNTEYYYTVFAYNGSGTSINYRIVTPLQGSQLTPIAPPASSPVNLVFSTITPGSLTVTYSAAPGSPIGYVAIRKTGSSPTFIPELNTTYTVGAPAGDGVIVHFGAALTFNESGLDASTTYYYDVFAFNQIGSLIGYQTSSPLEGSVTTFTAEPTAQPPAVVITEPATTSLKISFTAATPEPTGYLALRNANSAPTMLPADGQGYEVGSPIGDATVAYVGPEISFVDSGLQPGIMYHYQIFSYNGGGASTNYLTNVNASNSSSKITVPGKPTTPTASEIGQTQFRINWTATTGADSYLLDVSQNNFTPPVSTYAVNGITQVVNGLETGTVYKFRIRAVNASGTSVNSDEAQNMTVPATPVLSAATNIGQTSFTANWLLVKGATSYFIDVSLSNDFSTFVGDYNNKAVGDVISTLTNGLEPGLNYYYRLRSSNATGASPSSVVKEQLLIPATPTGLRAEAVNASTTYFRAEWPAVTGATGYRIDVTRAIDDFNPSLAGYDNRATDEGLAEQLVTDLTSGTDYRFRVRAVNSVGTSPTSASIQIRTQLPGTGLPLQLSVPSYTPTFTGTLSNASVIASGGTPPYVLSFFYRPITGIDYSVRLLTATGTSHQAAIDASMLDDLGIEFHFKVTDANGIPVETGKHYIYRAVSSEGVKIPFTKSGGIAQSYELFSIPYQLTKDRIDEIFEELGAYKKSQWRLVRYQNGRNVDYGEGVSRIELGKGYWFNRKENVEIFFSNATVANANQSSDAIMRLEPGWNQIGNPFPFNVDWNDILTFNTSATLIGNLRVFNPVGFHLDDESNTLKTWGGGFVHNGNSSAVDLRLPVTLKATAGGRKSDRTIASSQLDQPEWFVPIIIQRGEVVTSISGIGMHPDASVSVDCFDDFVAPRFINYQEFYSTHEEFFTPKFAKDVVPTDNTYSWNIMFESIGGRDRVAFRWDKEAFGLNEAQLILYDVSNNILVDMKTASQYAFVPASKQQFKIFYGFNSESLRPDMTVLGNAYPNPFSDGNALVIPFIVNQSESKVSVTIIDMMGRSVISLTDATYGYGIHQTVWSGKTHTGEPVAPGMYLYQLDVNGRKMIGRIIKQ